MIVTVVVMVIILLHNMTEVIDNMTEVIERILWFPTFHWFCCFFFFSFFSFSLLPIKTFGVAS